MRGHPYQPCTARIRTSSRRTEPTEPRSQTNSRRVASASPGPSPTMSDVLNPFDDAATIAGIIASTQRWLELAVIGLNLCPFAKAVYVKRQIRYAVTAATTTEQLLAELRHELELLRQANPQEVDTTLLIHPTVMSDFI